MSSVFSFFSGCLEWCQKSQFEESLFVSAVVVPTAVLVAAYAFKAFKETNRQGFPVEWEPTQPSDSLRSRELFASPASYKSKSPLIHVESTSDLRKLAGRCQSLDDLDALLDVPLGEVQFK